MTESDDRLRILANVGYRSMETAAREDGTEYTRKRQDCPEWVAELIREAHDGLMPDDWRYATIREAFITIAEADDLDEAGTEFADSADVYNSDLLAWVSSNANRGAYVDEARAEFGPPRDFFHSLQMGQYVERAEVYASVLAGLRAEADR
jgi:hypothetical protein